MKFEAKVSLATYGSNEELGRHKGREGKCTLYGADCESVAHVLCK